MKKDVVVIGAGAAGLFCAAEAGKRGRSVLIIEHSERIGKKIRASGGGRCNFTNLMVRPEHYISRNPHFCKSALARFTPADFISLLKKQSIGYHEKEEGQLFCLKGSSAITDMLERECKEAGVGIRLNCRILGIRKDHGFAVLTNRGTVESGSLVIATGGLSYAALGASDLGYRIARQFGLAVTPLSPGLVPLTLGASEGVLRKLNGISLNVLVSIGKMGFRGGLLFTHRGLSGPAVLQVSSYWKKGHSISVDLLPHLDAGELFAENRESRMELHTLLSAYIPRRLAHAWCELHSASKPLAEYSAREMKKIVRELHHWEIRPQGTEGYGNAEVTSGGVDTDELSSKTMESKKVPGLYFVGEVMDVTGQLGGYNLHWAWASGYAAGQHA